MTTPPNLYWPSYQSEPADHVDWQYDIYCEHLGQQLGPCQHCDDAAYLAWIEDSLADPPEAPDYDTRAAEAEAAYWDTLHAKMEAHRYDHIPTDYGSAWRWRHRECGPDCCITGDRCEDDGVDLFDHLPIVEEA